MRLLNACTGEIKEFLSDYDIPPFAILSHTWEDEEISYQDWQNLPSATVAGMQGFRKLRFCCDQAIQDGFEWVWIDTCCIDKTSSAELSEAINAMFSWYQRAAVCYVYLFDVASFGLRSASRLAQLTRSRWFTRGWTLQELLAPKQAVFYARDWTCLGTKATLVGAISTITGIGETFLTGEDLQNAPICRRMSWASGRRTSRLEDMAYSLLGIFDVQMPLLYGEGAKAFQRLQVEIIKSYPHDQTIFAWGVEVPDLTAAGYDVVDAGSISMDSPPPWSEKASKKQLFGLLAETPNDFKTTGHLQPLLGTAHIYDELHRVGFHSSAPTAFGKGISATLPGYGVLDKIYLRHQREIRCFQSRSYEYVFILCGSDGHIPSFHFLLHRWGHNFGARTKEFALLSNMATFDQLANRSRTVIYQAPKPDFLEHGDILFGHMPKLLGGIRERVGMGHHFTKDGVFRPARSTKGPIPWQVTTELPHGRLPLSINILFKRGWSPAAADTAKLYVPLCPVIVGVDRICGRADNPTGIKYGGLSWRPIAEIILQEQEVTVSHKMKVPLDTWSLVDPGFPKIRVRVERMPLENGRGLVDVVGIECLDVEEFMYSLSSVDGDGTSPSVSTTSPPRSSEGEGD